MKTTLGAATFLCTLGIAAAFHASAAAAQEGPYIGLFGGTGASIATSLQQRGAVHLNERQNLPINARGSTGSSTSVALGGLHLGYAWNPKSIGQAGWAVQPAVEIEGLHIGKHSPMGEMPVMPRALGTQYVTVPMTSNVLLANFVLNVPTPYSDKITPYLGAGAGVAFLSIKGADSFNPMEPGINHFNSDPDARDTAFAVQLKAGLKADISKNLSLFTEYRHLSIDASRYTFGATDYPGLHLPTAHWRVDLGRQKYNLFVAGLQYRF